MSNEINIKMKVDSRMKIKLILEAGKVELVLMSLGMSQEALEKMAEKEPEKKEEALKVAKEFKDLVIEVLNQGRAQGFDIGGADE